jgi:low temperature requirement protein LtrA
MTGTSAELLRDRGKRHHAASVELFFDLVYVFAVTQLSHTLTRRLDPVGGLQTLVLLLAVWWQWSATTWVLNWFDPESRAVRLLVLAAMLASLLMSAALPQAFGARGLWFAGTYVAIELGRTLFAVIAMRERSLHRNFLRVLFVFCVSGALWIAGAFLDEHARMVTWSVTIGLEYLLGALGMPTPGLGRSSTADWNIAPSHMDERYQQFLIIALGESVVVSGATLADGPLSVMRLVAFALAFAGIVAMWWIAFHRVSERVTAAFERSSDPGRWGRAYSFILVLIFAGIIVTAVGIEIVITHAFEPMALAWTVVLCGGPLLFVTGHTLLLRLCGPVPWWRWLAIALMALSALPLRFGCPMTAQAFLSALLLIVAAGNDRLPDTV